MLNDYLKFLLASSTMWGIYFMNPDYKPITNLFDKYANYPTEFERVEAHVLRQSTKIV